jgi:hypothetical protein
MEDTLLSHYASATWNNPAGLVAQIQASTVTAATGTSSAEGTDKLTYTTVRAGLYRVTVYASVTTAGSGASQAVVGQVAYTDATGAKSAGDISTGGATITKLDLPTATARLSQSQVIKATSGSAITVTMSGSGTFTTAGIYSLDVVIEAL